MMKIIFISPYPQEGPSYRYRVEQFFPYLRRNKIKCFPRPFLSSQFYRIVYKPGNIHKKFLYFILSSLLRIYDFFKALSCNLIFIHLEAYPLGPPILEYLWSKLGKKIIYDFDDAIYLPHYNSSYKIINFLKFPAKVSWGWSVK